MAVSAAQDFSREYLAVHTDCNAIVSSMQQHILDESPFEVQQNLSLCAEKLVTARQLCSARINASHATLNLTIVSENAKSAIQLQRFNECRTELALTKLQIDKASLVSLFVCSVCCKNGSIDKQNVQNL